MAQADFNFTQVQTGGGGGGEAYLNASLSNPLPGSFGSYCRRHDSTASGGFYHYAWYKSTFNGGAFYGVPSTQAITARGAVRIGVNNPSYNPYAYLMVKVVSNPTTGYGIGLYGSTPEVVLTYNNNTRVTLQALGNNTWVGLRLDVFPIGTAADQLIAYVETTPGSGAWTEIHNETIPSGDGRYAPWGSTRRVGYACGSSSLSANTNPCYFDGLDFRVKDV